MPNKILFILALTLLAPLAGGSLKAAHLLNKKGAKDPYGKDLGGIMPFSLTMLPEILFGACFGYAFYVMIEYIPVLMDLPTYVKVLWSISVAGWAYGWMETGHWHVLLFARDISGYPPAQQAAILEELAVRKPARLYPVAKVLAKILRIKEKKADGTHTLAYCRMFFALKGFLIGLPFGGIPFAFAWPAAYEIGTRTGKHIVSEASTGLFSSIIIIGVIALVKLFA